MESNVSLRISTVQFEHRSGDKAYNLSRITELSREAAAKGAEVVAFHECSVTGYTFAQKLSKDELADLAEPIPYGSSTQHLIQLARELDIHILAGLFEKGDDGYIYKAQVCVNGNGLVAKHRKIHPFINPHIRPGNQYTVFNIKGWTCGILICYDNNIIENVRATTLLGAEIIFMPHVTMGTPSPRPGAGYMNTELWKDRVTRDQELRQEFDGLKGRAWLMKWLPARAYDNGIYVVFSNPIGMDDDQLRNGCSMILDPFGEIMTECRELGDGMVLADLTRDNLSKAGGRRYIKARKPELYRDIIGRPHESDQKVAWKDPI